jgi:hypothetical protein
MVLMHAIQPAADQAVAGLQLQLVYDVLRMLWPCSIAYVLAIALIQAAASTGCFNMPLA